MVPNIFVDVELIKSLVDKYDPKREEIQLHDGFDLYILSKDLISNFSLLECSLNLTFIVRYLAID
jgi:hypothetical protein